MKPSHTTMQGEFSVYTYQKRALRETGALFICKFVIIAVYIVSFSSDNYCATIIARIMMTIGERGARADQDENRGNV